MIRSTFGPGTIVLGGGAVVLLGILAIGFVLPTDWEASGEATIEAESAELIPFLDSPEGWRRWTAWPDSGLTRSGPDRGAGARIAWEDRELGAGSFSIASVSDTLIRYEVVVDGAANTLMTTHGVITIEPLGGASLVRWQESGDLGRNPLMGFWGLSMERAQSAEMAKGLDRLSELATDESPVPDDGTANESAPADTVSTGAG